MRLARAPQCGVWIARRFHVSGYGLDRSGLFLWVFQALQITNRRFGIKTSTVMPRELSLFSCVQYSPSHGPVSSNTSFLTLARSAPGGNQLMLPTEFSSLTGTFLTIQYQPARFPLSRQGATFFLRRALTYAFPSETPARSTILSRSHRHQCGSSLSEKGPSYIASENSFLTAGLSKSLTAMLR